MSPIVNPPPAPEGSSSKKKPQELLNKPCLIRPSGTDVWGPDSLTPGKTYVVCDVWELDRAGIVEHHEGMWLGWWKTVEQLRHSIGDLIVCRPVKGDDNSISLEELTGDALTIAMKVADAIEAAAPHPDERPFSEQPDVF